MNDHESINSIILKIYYIKKNANKTFDDLITTLHFDNAKVLG